MAYVSYILIMCVIVSSSLFGKEAEKISTPASSEEQTAVKAEEKRKITIINTIVKKDLGYYKCWMTHYPSEFNVYVNGKKLDSKEQMVVEESRLVVTYAYAWNSPFGRVKKVKLWYMILIKKQTALI